MWYQSKFNFKRIILRNPNFLFFDPSAILFIIYKDFIR